MLNIFRRQNARLSPPQNLMLGFALMIFSGAFLLNLPIASRSGESVGFLNALFTATSANCVTGLVVVTTYDHWSLFGKAVILLLIQAGGLGAITITTLGMLLFHQQVSLRNRRIIQASFNQDSIGGMVQLVRRIIAITLLFEAAGALLFAAVYYHSTPTTVPYALFQGVFHAVSAFCNAGFDNIGPSSLVPYQTNIPINLILMALIVAGGLGFTVWSEIGLSLKNPRKRSLRLRVRHLSLHTKIVFIVTGVLLLAGTLLFLLLEWSNPATLGPLTIWQKLLAALFQSVTLRTAGFNSIAQDGLTDISQFFSCILMIIGGSSASTAGGIKTVTLGVIVISVLSVLRGRGRLEAFGRTLPLDLLQKALTVVGTMTAVVLAATTLLHFTEQGSAFPHSFLDLLFETCSAAGTVGVTTGITPHLSEAGKLVLIVCMFMGRLSPVTVVVALQMRLHGTADNIGLPTERVIIG